MSIQIYILFILEIGEFVWNKKMKAIPNIPYFKKTTVTE